MSTPMTAERLAEFTPPSLREKHPEIVILLRVPTWEQKDEITLKMYRYGVRSVSQDLIRAAMISELFRIRGDEAEEDALFLEDYWTQTNAHEDKLAEWRDRETQRLADIDAGAINVPEMEAPPEMPLGVKSRARANVITQAIIDGSEMVRAKLADQHEYSARFAMLQTRMQIAGWYGLKAIVDIDEHDVLTKESVERLRTALAPKSRHAWNEIMHEAQRMFVMDPGEEGNSDSPPENSSRASGSPPPSDGSASAPGPSTKTDAGTTSSTDQTRVGGSPKHTARSSGSTRGSAAGKKKGGPTGGR